MSNRTTRRFLRWTTLPLTAAFGAAGCVPLAYRDSTTPTWSSVDDSPPSASDLLSRWMLPSTNEWSRYQK
ncbi:MAG: hypothetical protein ACHREM_24050, partial [Polyangiales bacterium]